MVLPCKSAVHETGGGLLPVRRDRDRSWQHRSFDSPGLRLSAGRLSLADAFFLNIVDRIHSQTCHSPVVGHGVHPVQRWNLELVGGIGLFRILTEYPYWSSSYPVTDEPMSALLPSAVSIVRTASTLPDRIVSNREIGELLTANVHIDDEAAADIVAKTRERSELIEKKTGLRARRFFAPNQSPVSVGVELLDRLLPTMHGQRSMH